METPRPPLLPSSYKNLKVFFKQIFNMILMTYISPYRQKAVQDVVNAERYNELAEQDEEREREIIELEMQKVQEKADHDKDLIQQQADVEKERIRESGKVYRGVIDMILGH